MGASGACVNIRLYTADDEPGWVRCRVLSFLDTSYYRDVKREKETYAGDSVCLVAEANHQIVGLLDVELESAEHSICLHSRGKRGCVIWNAAVLPEYRQQHIGTALWQAARRELAARGVNYCEVWTQEDPAANAWYTRLGFKLLKEDCWLRCQVSQTSLMKEISLIISQRLGKGYLEEMVFQAVKATRDEVESYCDHVDEVRLYAMMLQDN